MALANKYQELQRLVQAFKLEATKRHSLTLAIEFGSRDGIGAKRQQPNHELTLWQNSGTIGAYGLCFAAFCGQGYEHFAGLSARAGDIFDICEKRLIDSRISEELKLSGGSWATTSQSIVATDDPLALWLSFILYHFNLVTSVCTSKRPIELDPVSLSLIAIGYLNAQRAISKLYHNAVNINLSDRVLFSDDYQLYINSLFSAICTRTNSVN